MCCTGIALSQAQHTLRGNISQLLRNKHLKISVYGWIVCAKVCHTMSSHIIELIQESQTAPST